MCNKPKTDTINVSNDDDVDYYDFRYTNEKKKVFQCQDPEHTRYIDKDAIIGQPLRVFRSFFSVDVFWHTTLK